MDGLRCQAIQTEHGLCIAERTQKAVFIVRCLCFTLMMFRLEDHFRLSLLPCFA
jgi:hypothetical protein